MAKASVISTPVPEVIVDEITGTKYLCGKFCGKGAFAKCYEIEDMNTNRVFAAKIIPKERLESDYYRNRMVQEINLHRSVYHKHIVRFYNSFEDEHFVYIVLELCNQKSLKELCSRRKILTEPETRYFMKQILDAVLHLHETAGILHRDLKLANILLNDELEVKIGDFGLATKIEYEGQRKTTLCGTPNYVAPEILKKQGHGFEVDVWSLGCIMYTLLVGKTPFEMATLRSTCERIKKCLYVLPTWLKPEAANLVNRMLQPDPKKRPSVKDILQSDFFKGYIPNALPHSCLTVAPREDTILVRESLTLPTESVLETSNECDARNSAKGPPPRVKKAQVVPSVGKLYDERMGTAFSATAVRCLKYLKSLNEQLENVLKIHQLEAVSLDEDELTDPEAQPVIWVSKWLDYSHKYGFGYQLSDDSLGIAFNDDTCIVLLANERNVHYIEVDGAENYYTLDKTPAKLDKKVVLLYYFRKYMKENLVKAGASVVVREPCQLSRTPYLYQWQRTTEATIMQLTNGTLQINFQDHTKIIVCPLMEAVTYIDEEKNFLTYKFSTICQNGCSPHLHRCLAYARKAIRKLIEGT